MMSLMIKHMPMLFGQITVPPSKSHSIRAIFLASLSQGESFLHNVLYSGDIQDAIGVCSQLGATIRKSQSKVEDPLLRLHDAFLPKEATKFSQRQSEGAWSEAGCDLSIEGIKGKITCSNERLKTGNSGIATRFVLPLLGLRGNTEQPVVVDCGEQMRRRSLEPLIQALRQLGLSIECLGKQNACPLRVSGSLEGGIAQLAGISSQNLSALLLALPYAEKDSVITVNCLQSRPYVDMTLGWLKQHNILYDHQQKFDSDIFALQGRQSYKKFETFITGDFSSASCLMAAGVLIPGVMTLSGLYMGDTQGDKALLSILEKMGADIRIESDSVTLYGGKKLNGMAVDARHIPDLLPALAVIGTYATGKTEILHVKHARMKETDRISSMVEGLRRLGARVEEHAEGMTVYQSQLIGAPVRGFGDHRTIMALAIAGLLARGTTCIESSEGIHKTFPDFVKMLQAIGARIQYV